MKQFKKNKLKLLAMLMTLMMIFTMIPATAFATDGDGYEGVPSATVTLSLSRDAAFMVGEGSGQVMAFKEITVPYFDLANYGLEQYYFVSESYGDDGDGLPGSDLEPGTAEYADGKVTLLHLYIYALEVYYCGIEPEEAGQGYLYDEGLIGTEVFSISGSQGSSFLNQFWGGDCNLNYYVNHEYPLASEGWGATSDQILLRDGDFISLGHFDNWSFYSDPRSIFNYIKAGEVVDSVTVSKGDEVTLSLFCAGPNMGTSYDTAQNPITYEPEVFCKPIEEVYSDPSYADVATWNNIGCADENGELVFDTSDLEAGEYLVCLPGQSGEYSEDICSTPGGIKLIVEETSVHEHAFNKEVAEDKYLASEATYTKAAEYYKSCECGEAGEETFVYGENLKQQITNLQEALDKAEADNALNKKEIADLETALEEALQAVEEAKTLTEKQKQELSAEINSLKDSLDAAKKENADNKEVFETQIADLTAKLEKAEADSAAVKAELEGKITELKEALENADAADKEAMQKEIKSLQDALKAAEEDSAAKQKELAGQIEQLQKDIADAKTLTDKQKEELSSEITSLKTALDASDAEKQAMQEEIDALKAELEQLKENKQLAAPIGVKAFNNTVTGKNRVSWKAVAGAEEYAVYRSTSKNGAYKKMFTTTGTTYTNTSAKAGTLYYYKVKALTGDKSVDDSKFSAVVKRTCDLKKPVVTAKSPAKKQVKLTWKKVSGAKKYAVYRATSKNGKYTKIATTSKLSYTNKKLKSGKTYYYKVKAIAKNSAANSAFSTVDKCKSR